MQIPSQKLLYLRHLQTLQRHPAHLLLVAPVRHQRCRQRYHITIHQPVLVLLAAVVAVVEAAGCEDAVDADEACVVVPGAGVRVEVAEEEEDLEGAFECESDCRISMGPRGEGVWLTF
jgi:hypothetical protein